LFSTNLLPTVSLAKPLGTVSKRPAAMVCVPTLEKTCRGEAGCFWNLLCCPFVLIWKSIEVYLLSCIVVLARRLLRAVCMPVYGVCECCLGKWIFTDTSFEGDSAVGQPGKSLDWVRAYELLSQAEKEKGQKPRLYEGGIEPADLCQGAVGDCWLVAALACAAEHPACIRNAFHTAEANSRGMYKVRLHDPTTKRWTTVTVDDRLPCTKGTKHPEFMKCDGKELWAVILEKAFAKFCGSYAALNGGWCIWGWAALTGNACFRLKWEGGVKKWKKVGFEAKRAKDGTTDGAFFTTSEAYSKDQVWNLLLNYIDDRSLVAASGGKDMGKNMGSGGGNSDGLNGEQLNEAAGLVGGHAYSILDAKELGLLPGVSFGGGLLGQTRLVRLRNPWGNYEWKGAWSDGSKEWSENPIVKARLRPKDEDDGTFWMPWDVFAEAGFTNIDICDRDVKHDLRLAVEEDYGCLGIFLGFLSGCSSFWCLCRGCAVLYCGATPSDKTKTTKRGCGKCMDSTKDALDPKFSSA